MGRRNNYFSSVRREMRSLWNCLVCLLCAGPICVIIGVIMISQAARNPRASLVKNYNAKLDAWTEGSPSPMSQFAGTSGWSITHSSGTPVNLGLDTSPTANVPSVDSGKVTQPRVARFATSATDGLISTHSTSSTSFNTQITLHHGSQNVVIPVVAAYYTSETLTCNTNSKSSSSSTHNCPTDCNLKGGLWDYSRRTCTMYYAMTDICAVLDASTISSGSTPRLYPAYSGCALTKDHHISGIVGYRSTDPPSLYSAATHTFPLPFSYASSIRSSDDPWVYAAKETSGSMSFGLTAGDYLKLAAVFFAIGGVMSIVPCCVMYGCARCLRSKREDKHHHDFQRLAPDVDRAFEEEWRHAEPAPVPYPQYEQPPQRYPPPPQPGQVQYSQPPQQAYAQPPPSQAYAQPPPQQAYAQPPPSQVYGHAQAVPPPPMAAPSDNYDVLDVPPQQASTYRPYQ